MKQNHRNWTNLTHQDQARDAAAATRSMIRRCQECASSEFTVIEGKYVCRQCHTEMKVDSQPRKAPR